MEPALEAKITHLLALQEGLYELRQEFQRARDSTEFAGVYTKDNPLVSINIATYNRESLLVSRCLASLIRQTYRNLQIVVVGDGCRPETEAAIARIRDSRIVFDNLPHNGPYPPPGPNRWMVAGTNAMNRALEICTGDFITHIDDDDEMSPERIEKLLTHALKTRAEFVWHRFLYQNPDGLWRGIGSDELRMGQVTTGSIFYHRYFRKIPWDIRAYRTGEPGDWNRIRKIVFLRPVLSYVDECLMIHYQEQNQNAVSQEEFSFFLEE